MGLPAETTIAWYGHACCEIRTPGGRTVLIDPWFGNPLSTRTPDSVERCDLLLVTHGHSDHLGDGPAAPSAPEGVISDHERGRPSPAWQVPAGLQDGLEF